MKIIVKEVGKEAEVKEIEGTLEDLQAIVGGYAERIKLTERFYMLVNEEGNFQRLPLNIIMKSEKGPTPIVGNVCFVHVAEGGEMVSLNDFQMNWVWLRLKEAGHATDPELGAYRLGVLTV